MKNYVHFPVGELEDVVYRTLFAFEYKPGVPLYTTNSEISFLI